MIIRGIQLGNFKKTNSSSEICFCCPFCSHVGKEKDVGFHLYVSLSKKKYYCQRCGEKGSINDEHLERYKYYTPNKEFVEKKYISESILNDYVDLSKSALGMKYWKNRGFDEKDAVYFKIKYNEELNRLVIPVYENEIYQFSIQRSIFNLDEKKYLFDGLAKKSLVLYNYDNVKNEKEIFIVEGTMDVFALFKMDKPAVCIFGKNISENQFFKIIKLSEVNLRKVIVSLDQDAKVNAIKLMDKFRPYIEVENYILKEFKDFSEKWEKMIKMGKEG